MDGISTTSSGIAVISLTIQLAENVKKLCDFWYTVKGSPEQMLNLVADLRVLSHLLHEIAYNDETLHKEVAEGCFAKIQVLSKITGECEAVFSSSSSKTSRRWAAIKSAFNQERIDRFKRSLEETKSTLLIAQQSSLRKRLRLQDESHKHDFALLAQAQQQGFHLLQEKLHDVHVGSDTRINAISQELRRCQTANFAEVRQLVQAGTASISNPVWRHGVQRVLLHGLIGSDAETEEEMHQDRSSVVQPSTHGLSPSHNPLRPLLPPQIRTRPPFAGPESVQNPDETIRNVRCSSRHRRYLRRRAFVSTSSGFGVVRRLHSEYEVCETNHRDHEDLYSPCDQRTSSEYIVTYRPRSWLVNLGFDWRASVFLATSPFRLNLNVSRTLSWSADIFRFCQDGLVGEVREAITIGQASLWDVTPDGDSLLHIAAANLRAEACEALIAMGASSERDDQGLMPIMYVPLQQEVDNHHARTATITALTHAHCSFDDTFDNAMNQGNSFENFIDFSNWRECSSSDDLIDSAPGRLTSDYAWDIFSEDWTFFLVHTDHGDEPTTYCGQIHDMVKNTVITSYLRPPEGHLKLRAERIVSMIFHSRHSVRICDHLLALASSLGCNIDWSPLLHMVARSSCTATVDTIISLIKAGADPHYVDTKTTLTITCAAAVQSNYFQAWKSALLKLNTDMDSFFLEEAMRMSGQTKWTSSFLRTLFHYQFQPSTSRYGLLRCRNAACPELSNFGKDMRWLRVVARIQRGYPITEEPDELEHQTMAQLKREVESVITCRSATNMPLLEYDPEKPDMWDEYRVALLNSRVLPKDFDMCFYCFLKVKESIDEEERDRDGVNDSMFVLSI